MTSEHDSSTHASEQPPTRQHINELIGRLNSVLEHKEPIPGRTLTEEQSFINHAELLTRLPPNVDITLSRLLDVSGRHVTLAIRLAVSRIRHARQIIQDSPNTQQRLALTTNIPPEILVADDIRRALLASGPRVGIEILEGAQLEPTRKTAETIQILSTNGVHIAIDDVVPGYASKDNHAIHNLRVVQDTLPPGAELEVKIDRKAHAGSHPLSTPYGIIKFLNRVSPTMATIEGLHDVGLMALFAQEIDPKIALYRQTNKRQIPYDASTTTTSS